MTLIEVLISLTSGNFPQAKQHTAAMQMETEVIKMKEEINNLRSGEEVAKENSNKVVDLEVNHWHCIQQCLQKSAEMCIH